MWALGCVLHELVTLRVAFPDVWYIRQYASAEFELPAIEGPLIPEFLQHHLSGIILDLLNTNSKRRPKASDIKALCHSFCQVLGLSIAQTLLDVLTYPSYVEWKQLVANHPTDQEFLFELMTSFEAKREKSAFIAIRDILLHDVVLVNPRMQMDCGSCDVIICEYFAEKYLEKANYNGAIGAYENAIEKDPTNFWLWHNLCKVYLLQNDYDGAIAACKQGIAQLPSNWSPMMAMGTLYATVDNYKMAIDTYMQMNTDGCRQLSLWHNFLSGVELSHPIWNVDEVLIKYLKP